MKNLNQLISDYTHHMESGEIQKAYREILGFISRLRADLVKKFPDYEASGVYQGYLDMSYFSLIDDLLKGKGLKIAIVYLHGKGCFEVWLSARNRNVARQYVTVFNADTLDGLAVFHDDQNLDAIIECTLTTTSNFEEQELLMATIERGVERFTQAVSKRLMSESSS